MSESIVSIDLLNPGQIFACVGILEVIDKLFGAAQGRFVWKENVAEGELRVLDNTNSDPVREVLKFLESAEVVTRSPYRSFDRFNNVWNKKWGAQPMSDDPDDPFPYKEPDSLATLPVRLLSPNFPSIAVDVDHWGDSTRQRDNVKFWAGSGGYPGTALLRDALLKFRKKKSSLDTKHPFSFKVEQSSSFRFDWRRDYIPNDIGFTLNRTPIQATGFPLVEILAAIGLTHARPLKLDKLAYKYGVIGGDFLPLSIIRLALGSTSSPISGYPFRLFSMVLGWPGKEGQARCITTVREEIKT